MKTPPSALFLLAALAPLTLRADVVAVDGAVPFIMDAGGTAENPAEYIIGDTGAFVRDFLEMGLPAYVGESNSHNRLIVRLGSELLNTSGYIGFDGAGNGATVTGAGSAWTNSGTLHVGQYGTGSFLAIEDGGTVSSGRGIIGRGLDSSAAYGNANSATVSGTGSIWTNAGALHVGYYGSGNSLVIESGGAVSNASSGIIGEGLNSNPALGGNNSVTVTGAGSTWTNAIELFVGLYGSGNSLIIENGGTVSGKGGYIGHGDLSNPLVGNNNSVTVTGTGSTWTNTGDLHVGYHWSSNNTLTIADGGKVIVSADADLRIANGGAVNLNAGGTLEVGGIFGIGPGIGAVFNFAGGTIRVAGASLDTPVNATLGAATSTIDMGNLDAVFSGDFIGSGTLAKTGGGTLTLSGSNSHGETLVEDGMLLILGDSSEAGAVTVEAGAALGGTGTVSGVIVKDGGTLAPGASPGLLTIEGNLTLHETATVVMEFTGTNAGAFDQIAVGGLFTAGGTLYLDVSYAAAYGDTFTLFTDGVEGRGWDAGGFLIASNLGGGLFWNTGSLATSGIISIVPEPSATLLLALGAGALLLSRRKRNVA